MQRSKSSQINFLTESGSTKGLKNERLSRNHFKTLNDFGNNPRKIPTTINLIHDYGNPETSNSPFLPKKKLRTLDQKFTLDFPNLSKTSIHSLTATKDDQSLFLGDGSGILTKFSIQDQRVSKIVEFNSQRTPNTDLAGDQEKIEITSMLATADNEHLFVGDNFGCITQFLISDLSLVKEYGNLHHKPILSQAATSDSQMLFTSDQNGDLRQILIPEKIVIKTYTKVHIKGIWAIELTEDNKNFFSSDEWGSLRQFRPSVKDYILDSVKEYGKVMNSGILALKSTKDGMWLFCGDQEGKLLQISIEESRIVRDYGTIGDGSAIMTLAVTNDSKFLFLGMEDGTLKKVLVKKQAFGKTYGHIHEYLVSSLCVTQDDRYLFTGSYDGHMKMISIKDEFMSNDYGVKN